MPFNKNIMDIIENGEKSEKEKESNDLLEIPITFEDEKYLLKIFPSKDNISIIFKLEKENIQTYYYYSKFKAKDFIPINENINSDTNIINIFIDLRKIIQLYNCSIEKKSIKVNILFTRKNNENSTVIFSLKKKLVSQARLNSNLFEQILENKSKIKILKKKLVEMDKNIINKNDSIDIINNNIEEISDHINNINISINKENENSSLKEEKKENEILIENAYEANEKDKLLLKKNLSLINENSKDIKTEEKNNNYKKKKKKIKKQRRRRKG